MAALTALLQDRRDIRSECSGRLAGFIRGQERTRGKHEETGFHNAFIILL